MEDADPENSCVRCTSLNLTPASPTIRAPLLEILNDGKLADVVISFREQNRGKLVTRSVGGEEDAKAMHEEKSTSIARAMVEVVDILYDQKKRLDFTFKLMSDANKIMVIGADLELIKDLAAVKHVADIDGVETVKKKQHPLWNRFKRIWRWK